MSYQFPIEQKRLGTKVNCAALVRARSLLGKAVICAATFCLTSVSIAQNVCLPLPRLLTTWPMGGTAGSHVEVTITGENAEDAAELNFTHHGLTAVRKLDANGQPEVNKFIVTIAADCPPGIYEARLMTRLGISSSRVFSVGPLSEVTQTAPNTTLATAMELKVNSVCNSVASAKAVDHYVFEAQKGQRYIVHCASREIDSKLDAVLIIADAAGRDLVVDRRSGTLDFTAQADGKHVIKVHELTYRGGPEFFYRLTLQELSAEALVPQFASIKPVSSFSWPPIGLSESAAASEAEPNNSHAQCQKVTLPCDLSGAFFPAADVDCFEFTATKGDVWWVEVASERLGRPTNPTIVVQHIRGENGTEQFTDVAEFSDIPSPIKPSSNGYAYDGPPIDGGSTDILGKLEIKENGVHRLQLTDLFGGTRNDPGNVYRLIIRKATPDFALAAWGLHMELRNGDRNALSKPIALRCGTTMALEVMTFRRDGFEGDIDLVVEGLPAGVSAQEIKIPAGKTRGILLITADQSAPRGLAKVSFYGKSQIDGATVTRPCRMASMVWPVPDAWSEIPTPRLDDGMYVSVTDAELAPITIKPHEKKLWEVAAGEKLSIPLTQTRRCEFSGPTLQLRTAGQGFEQAAPFDVSLTADRSEAVFDLGALKTPPGDYMIAFYGNAVAKYRHNPDSVTAAEAIHSSAKADAEVIAAEVQRLTAEVAAVPVEQKTEANAALTDATTKRKAADAALAAAAAKLKAATEKAAPRDTVELIFSEPIAIRVKPAGEK